MKSTFEQTPQETCIEDVVVVEEPLEVWVKNQHSGKSAKLLFTTMRTPGDDIHMIKGWFFTSGFVNDLTQIVSINHMGTGRLKNQSTNQILVTLTVDIDAQAYQRVEVVNSACGVCGQQSIEGVLEKLSLRASKNQLSKEQVPSIDKTALFTLTSELRKRQPLFIQTGGNHGSALFNHTMDIIDIREDVGRHNALDKLIGANIDTLSKLTLGVVLSGRVSFELVQKAVMANIRYIVAIGAPSHLAIDLAKDCDLCLVGFVKNSGFNCYAGAERLG